MEYWSEKYNQIPTFIPGEQSVVFPTAPVGIVYVGDKGVPSTLVPSSNRFSPRLGLAYSPGVKGGLLGKAHRRPGEDQHPRRLWDLLFGDRRQHDGHRRASAALWFKLHQPGAAAVRDAVYHRFQWRVQWQSVSIEFPPLNTSPKNPNSTFDFSAFEPIAGMTAPPPSNTYPYNENYFLSIERQFGGNTVLSLSYVGSQAHHLLLVYSANPGNPALCLKLCQPSAVAPGSPTCGPFGEDTTYITAAGQTIQGTRSGLGPAFANDDYDASVGNSNYNAFEATLRHSSKSLTF